MESDKKKPTKKSAAKTAPSKKHAVKKQKDGKKTSEQLMKEYGFWLWEYQRRNPTYREDYDEYLNFDENNKKKKINVKRFPKYGKRSFSSNDLVYHNIMQNFLQTHGRLPKDYIKRQIEPEQIIDDIHNKRHVHEIDDIGDLEIFKIMGTKFFSDPVDWPLSLEENPVVKVKVTIPEFELEIDTSKDLDAKKKKYKINTYEIKKAVDKTEWELKFWYYYFKSGLGPEQILFNSDKKQTKYRETFFKMVHEHHLKEDKKIKINPMARASGLLIYDYVIKNDCGPEKAIKNLTKYFKDYDGTKIQENTDRLKRYYNKTKECIEKVELLALD